jgi:hypothetical protein
MGLTIVTGLDPAARLLKEKYDVVTRFIDMPYSEIKKQSGGRDHGSAKSMVYY